MNIRRARDSQNRIKDSQKLKVLCQPWNSGLADAINLHGQSAHNVQVANPTAQSTQLWRVFANPHLREQYERIFILSISQCG
jgi:hypothetical protein